MRLRGSFTVNVQKVMDIKKLSVRDMSEKLYLPEWYVKKICSGAVNPSIYEVLLISDVLQTPINDLYWLDNEKDNAIHG